MSEQSILMKDIKEILVSEEQIRARVTELAKQIQADYEGKDLLMVCVLNGATPFYVDIMMELDLPLQMSFLRVSSYGNGTSSSGTVRILYDLETDVTGRDILLVDDIIDSGHTLKRLTKLLSERGAASVKCCVMLDKVERREVDMNADYVGFDVPNEFLVGYGLDYAGIYRNLRFIGTLKEEVYQK